MKLIKFLINACLVTCMLAHTSCGDDDNKEVIYESDEKYLSESQLFALHKAIENDSDNPELYYKRAKVYLERKDLTKALNDINKAIKLKGLEARYYYLQAKIYAAMKNFSASLNSAKTAETYNVEDAEVKILLSGLYLEMNEKEKAQKYLNEAFFLTPHHAEVNLLKGKILAMNGDTSSALGNFLEALKKDTGNAEVYKELTKIYFAKQKTDSSMIYLVSGRALEPEDPFFAYYEGRFLEQVNLKESAKKLYLTSLYYDSTYADAYRSMAMMHYKAGQFDQAANYFEKELKFNPNSIKSNLLLAEIYEEQGKEALAIPYLENVLQADSNNIKAKSSLEKLYKLYPKPAVAKEDSIKKPDVTETTPVTPPVQKKDSVKKTMPDTIKKTTPAVKDTVKRKPPPRPVNKGLKKDSNGFTPIITNPDSTKIETKKDTIK